jgi:hypothetical protein
VARTPNAAVALTDKIVAVHETLSAADIPHAFGGALSLGYHSAPRGTREIDLNVFLRPTMLNEVVVLTSGVRCPWDETHVDLFLPYDDEFFEAVQARIEEHIFLDSSDNEHTLPFLSAEDLVIFKINFNRPKDWVDIGSILEEKPLDVEYVEKWLLHLRGDRVWPDLRRFLRMAEKTQPSATSNE